MGAKMILPLSESLTSTVYQISFRKDNFTGPISILILENCADIASGDIDYGIDI